MNLILISRGVRPLRMCANCSCFRDKHDGSGKCHTAGCPCSGYGFKRSAKDYPYWDELIELLKKEGYTVEEIVEKPLDDLEEYIKSSLTVICGDSFIQHFCWSIGKKAIVLWGKSDPEIFGHPENINLLKSKDNLRLDPYRWWEDIPYDPSVFFKPAAVLHILRDWDKLK